MSERAKQPEHATDLLAWIEGEPLGAEASACVERALGADPGLRGFAEDARRDRDRLRALAEVEAGRAPAGIVPAAFEQAEREILLGHAPGAGVRPVRRLRITPVRFVAAAAVVILFASASLVGLIFTGRTPTEPRPGAGMIAQSAPALEQADENGRALALTEAPADLPTERSAAAPTELAAKPAPAADGFAAESRLSAVRQQAGSGAGASAQASRALIAPESAKTEIAAADDPSAALSFQLIRSVKAGPDHAVSPERAAELALQGRLMVVARSSDPAAVERELLSAAPAEDDIVVWRSILALSNDAEEAASTPTLPADAPRVVLADVLATPAAMEQLVATLTHGQAGPDRGAWLQQIDGVIRLAPAPVASDLTWWTRPGETWAPRVTVPVLIAQPTPGGPDAPPNEPSDQP